MMNFTGQIQGWSHTNRLKNKKHVFWSISNVLWGTTS
jgi:hypothetical protein